jgi:t-SNARE complex subunit (syntaxin)
MSNEMEFSAQTHNLLMKTKATISEHQESKNRSASIQASPQAARKKRFDALPTP